MIRKKILPIVMAVLCIYVAGMTGCGGKGGNAAGGGTSAPKEETAAGSEASAPKEENEIAKLYEQGFSCDMSLATDNVWNGEFTKEDDLSVIYGARADVSADEMVQIMGGMFDENYDDKLKDIICHLSNVSVTDLTDQIPGKEAFAAYIKGPISSLEVDGYEYEGMQGDEDKWILDYSGPEYRIGVTPAPGQLSGDIGDMDEEEFTDLIIDEIAFRGFSEAFLEK
ncbi:MAG: hypothetical protein Q4E57_07015 [Eubacteriales bacterium]|nr:hypothetical protein [Eubacteriales bacterium]